MEYAVWNTLHDGCIESIDGVVPGDVTVCVDIAYLCAKLPTTATYVLIRLLNCTRFEYKPFGEDAITNPADVGAANIEILRAEFAEGSVSVDCVNGLLRLAYDGVDIFLAEGTGVSQPELEAAASQYWTEWEENARQGR